MCIGYGSLASKSIAEYLRFEAFKNGFDGIEKTGINLFAKPLGNIVYFVISQITTTQHVHQCE